MKCLDTKVVVLSVSIVPLCHHTLTSGKLCCPETKDIRSRSSIFRTLTGFYLASLKWTDPILFPTTKDNEPKMVPKELPGHMRKA